MKKIALLLLLIITLFACETKEASKAEVVEQDIEEIIQETENVRIENIELVANLDNVRIRDVAGLKGKEIATVSKGEKLFYLNEMSDFTDEIILRGVVYNDPWLKVETTKGKVGWLYAGAIKFDMTAVGEDFKKQMVTKRLEKIFGNKLVFEIEQHQKSFANIKTDKDFILMYRNARALQTKLNTKLEYFFNIDEVTDFPDLFWINDGIPGLNAELVAEGTMYNLLFNYRELEAVTLKTPSELDDDFVNLLMAKNSGEFENFFAVWFLQTWDYGGYSLLGQGKHVAMLNRMQKLADKTALFDIEIKKMKNELFEDITDGNQYGEKKEKIIEEINEIINKKYQLITPDEIIALRTRAKMFESPEENEIEVFMKDF